MLTQDEQFVNAGSTSKCGFDENTFKYIYLWISNTFI